VRIVVSAAVIEDHDRYFVTRRQQGAHLKATGSFPAANAKKASRSTRACSAS
jgi:hypothetical protein